MRNSFAKLSLGIMPPPLQVLPCQLHLVVDDGKLSSLNLLQPDHVSAPPASAALQEDGRRRVAQNCHITSYALPVMLSMLMAVSLFRILRQLSRGVNPAERVRSEER